MYVYACMRTYTKQRTQNGVPDVVNQLAHASITWAPKVCNMIAFLAVYCGTTYLWGPGRDIRLQGLIVQGFLGPKAVLCRDVGPF